MSNLSLRCLLDTMKLTGSNFLDWQRNLRLVLRLERIEYVLDEPIPEVPQVTSEELESLDDSYAHKKHEEDAYSAQCYMLASMTVELQRQHEHMLPYEMIRHLEGLYASPSQTLEFDLCKELFEMKLPEGKSVSEHVLKMIGMIEKLASIGLKLPETLAVNSILYSLPGSYDNFIVNYNMNKTKASLTDLHNMLKNYESTVSKGKAVLMVSSSAAPNSKGKGKQKKKKKPASDAVALKPKGGVHKKPKIPNDQCILCHQKGHWKRDCPKLKAQGASSSGSGAK